MQKTQKIWFVQHRSNLLRSNHSNKIGSSLVYTDHQITLIYWLSLIKPGKYLNQPSENFDNFIVRRHFNIDIRETTRESHKLGEFCSLFSLANIIKSDTCFAKFHSWTIDLFLTNAIETGLSDDHKLMSFF